VAVLVVGIVAAMVLRAHNAEHDFVTTFSSFRAGRLPWLAVAAAAASVSVIAYGLAQRRLLRAGGADLPAGQVVALALAATGVSAVVPGGVVPAGGWLVGQYRRRAIPTSLAVWAFLAGGFAASVTVLGLLLVGAAIAGVGHPLVIAVSAGVLVVGSAAFVAAVHRLDALQNLVRRHHLRVAGRLVDQASSVIGYRAGVAGGSQVFGYSLANWVFDAVSLVAAFGLVGLKVPWAAILFAYAASQVAGSVVPLPAGLGAVEGGLVGALSLTGTPAGNALVAAVVYRVISYWSVAAIGSVVLVVLTHRSPAPLRAPQAAVVTTATEEEPGPAPLPPQDPLPAAVTTADEALPVVLVGEQALPAARPAA
jgi:uncharacterized membrane protein YbhN (UPF0104 family)